MAITIKQVPRWMVHGGYGHAVAKICDPGIYTACGTLWWGCGDSDTQTTAPKRICRKCRKRLKDATLIPKMATP